VSQKDSKQNAGNDAESPTMEIDRMTRQGRSFSGNERNCMFLNTRGSDTGSERFANISAVSGIDFPEDGRALAFVDWDQDGDLDLWISNRNAPRLRLLRNDTPKINDFIQFRLMGNGSDTNRDAIGARVTIELASTKADGNITQLAKTLRAGEGFLAQSSPWIHFGLGANATIKKISVRWPNREMATEEFEIVEPNGRYELTQGTGKPKRIESVDRQLALKHSTFTVPPPSIQQRIPLIFRLPAPSLGYFDFDGQPVDFNLDPNKVTLVNLWSSTCAPCLKELAEFSKRYDELEKAGIQILAISVDDLDADEETTQSASAALAQRLNFPFASGMAPASVVEEFRRLHNILIKMEKPLPMPTSFLIDRAGKLDIIYKGAVSVETLLADAKPIDPSLLQRFRRSAGIDGTLIDDAVTTSAITSEEAWVHVKLARELVAQGRTDEAIAEYQQVLQRVPDSATTYNNLGIQYQLKKNTAQATRNFQTAVELDPSNVDIRVNLAQALMAQQKFQAARAQLEQTISIDDNSANAHFNLGVVQARLKDFAASRDSYQRAIDIDPKHARAQFSLAKFYEQNNELEKAKHHYQLALEVVPNEVSILVSLGRIYLRESNFDEAERVLQLAVKNQPGYDEAHYQLGLVLQALGQGIRAKRQFEETLRINPRHAGATKALRGIFGGN
jgi:tetratricopeptide (TPR) repeat protein